MKNLYNPSVTFSVTLLLLLCLSNNVLISAGRAGFPSSTTTNAAHKFWFQRESRAPQIHSLLRSIPALSKTRSPTNGDDVDEMLTEEVAVKTKKKQPPEEGLAGLIKGRIPSMPSLPSFPQVNPDFFMGVTPQTVLSKKKAHQSKTNVVATTTTKKKKLSLREGMSEALEELRTMRYEMEEMRKEIVKLKLLQMGEELVPPEQSDTQKQAALVKRQHEFEQLANEISQWAEDLLFPEHNTQDGWTEVPCNKLFKNKFNPDGRIRTYLKWMKDTRGHSDITRQQSDGARSTNDEDAAAALLLDNQEWPCLRMYATIDASVDEVSLYLSKADRVTDYNQLVQDHKDLEEITPHSKICWGQTPQVLFIKSKDFVTFCHHRWRRDGTQVVVNQACDSYHDLKANAHALRGATFIGPDPDDPDKTRIAMLSHASPGSDIPVWACRTAIQSLAPIEPYRLFYKLNEGVKQCRDELQASSRRLREAELVSDGDDAAGKSTSRRPAGLAQLGYACFWPNGGGDMERVVGGTAAAEPQLTASMLKDNSVQQPLPQPLLPPPIANNVQEQPEPEGGGMVADQPDPIHSNDTTLGQPSPAPQIPQPLVVNEELYQEEDEQTTNSKNTSKPPNRPMVKIKRKDRRAVSFWSS